jgi:hypothetical protein
MRLLLKLVLEKRKNCHSIFKKLYFYFRKLKSVNKPQVQNVNRSMKKPLKIILILVAHLKTFITAYIADKIIIQKREL